MQNIQLKCRKCNETFSHQFTDDKTAKKTMSKIVLNQKVNFYGINFTTIFKHDCKDGGSGIADFVGFSPIDKEEKKPLSPNTDRTNSFIIGDFEISNPKNNDDKIWIFHKTGEGGQFSKKSFEKAVSAYYNINF